MYTYIGHLPFIHLLLTIFHPVTARNEAAHFQNARRLGWPAGRPYRNSKCFRRL